MNFQMPMLLFLERNKEENKTSIHVLPSNDAKMQQP